MKQIKKAVFPVAGFGTRFLPATKAMPKELLPIVDKPLVQYAAEEAIAAGIDTLIFVTGRNKRAIEDHFDSNKELEMALRASGKAKKADMVKNILPEGIHCIFVRQAEQLGLGHAVLCAERVVGGDPFAVLLADDLLFSEGRSVTEDLIRAYEKTGKYQLSVMQVDGPSISKYGVIVKNKNGRGISGIVEKPKVYDAPSNLASIGRYILLPDIFDILRNLPPGSSGEVQLTDALNIKAQHGQVEIAQLNGTRFDCGSVDGFVQATNHLYSTRKKSETFI